MYQHIFHYQEPVHEVKNQIRKCIAYSSDHLWSNSVWAWNFLVPAPADCLVEFDTYKENYLLFYHLFPGHSLVCREKCSNLI